MIRPFTFELPAYWTDEDALIVFEFIDDIREQIWDHYGLQIQSAAQSSRQLEMSWDVQEQGNEQADFFDDAIPF